MRNHIQNAIEAERAYQNHKWGNNPHDVGGWLSILRVELREAEDEWCGEQGNRGALAEILQIVSVGVACLEQHGVVTRYDLEAAEAKEEQ